MSKTGKLVDLDNLLKYMVIQNILLEASGWDEDRAKHLNEVLLYGIKTVPKEFLSNAPEESASLILATIESLVYEEEVSACQEALLFFFKELK